MDLGLKDKVAIIVGGGQGIGRVMVKTFAEEGAKVVIVDLNAANAEKVAREVKEIGGEAIAVQADVASLEAMEAMAKTVTDTFGRIDILVHSAAAFNLTPFMKTPPETWLKFINVSQIGAMNGSKAVLPSMLEHNSGRIIFIGSDAGRIGDAYQPIYASAKAGVIGFAKSLAQDYGRKGITVNVVCPALTVTDESRPVLTKMYGLDDEKRAKAVLSQYATRRLDTPEDIANMVTFLASERAGNITGQTISVNGGYCMV